MRYLTPALVGLLLGPAAAGSVIHVDDDAPPGGDGAGWPTAFRFLQDALHQASGAGEIRVAQGTYAPDRSEAQPGGSGNRTYSFHLDGGIAVQGGYAGLGAPDPDERDTMLYETILDGDLAGDDGPGFANRGENAYHVVRADAGATALLEGFTVRGGNADGSWNTEYGGGLFIVGAGPSIAKCTFRSNLAETRGGAVYVEDGWPQFDGCVFKSNYGDIGGAMQVRGASDVSVTDCEFEDNEGHAAGGIFKYEGNLTLIGCEFSTNAVVDSGGGIYSGYGMTALANCVFGNNQAGFHSGGAAFVQGNETLVNCVFSENTASIGGGIYCSSTMAIDTCTFSRNSPGGLVVDASGAPVFTNCILWGNLSYQIGHDPNFPWTPPPVYFSDIEGGWTGPGSDNIDADPLFVQAGTGDVRLTEGSPCLDAGSTSALPPDAHDLDGDGDTGEPLPVDLDGNPRVQGAAVDMGAYEGAFPPMAAADQVVGLDPGESVILIPDGSPFNPVVSAAVIVRNISGPVDSTFAVTLHDMDLHPGAGGYSQFSVTLVCETSMEPGQFRAKVFIPIDPGDLDGAEPHHANVIAYDGAVGNWALAVAGNTAASPGFGGPIGDRVVSLGGDWGTTPQLGDYGVFWNPAAQAGFAWANVDFVGDFSAGVALCPADCRQTPDGAVSVLDFLALLAS
ncbi:MAG: right-handed parallel beta-helix repeat-containing protein, partial [Planctomycetota bacterium]